uniref:Uncharacterized protein n=1 Tax=Heterorhabditis bacteriophora TaxID=37862 RepID=A0A1I7WWK1_HETBA
MIFAVLLASRQEDNAVLIIDHIGLCGSPINEFRHKSPLMLSNTLDEPFSFTDAPYSALLLPRAVISISKQTFPDTAHPWKVRWIGYSVPLIYALSANQI